MADSVAFIGLGIMGRPMAENLAKKFVVHGFDTNPERFKGISGVTQARSVAELVTKSKVICLSLPSAPAVEAVILGPGGVIEYLQPGSLIIDLSTGLPSLSQKIHIALSAIDCDYIDAPVSGGESGAKDGRLAIMVGAKETVYGRSLQYLSAMGSSVVRAGEVGAGGVAKLVNNMIVGVEFSVIAEGFALAVANGLDPLLLYNAIKDGWAGSKVLDVSAPAIASRTYTPGGTVNMIQKDLSYARTLASESHVSIPMTSLAHEMFVAAQGQGHGAESQPSLFELWSNNKS